MLACAASRAVVATSARTRGGATPPTPTRAIAVPSRRHPRSHVCRAGAPVDDEDDLFSFLEAQMNDDADGDAGGASSSSSGDDDGVPEPGSPMTGEELRMLVLNKWGKMYDTRIHQRRDQFNKLGLYLQIMWKHVGQKSFPMTEQQYVEQLNAVAELLTEWGAQDVVRQKLPQSTKFPKMDTTGANAVMIPLDIELDD